MPCSGFSGYSQRQSKRCYLVGKALLWGKKKEKDLEFHSVMYFLDGMEGKNRLASRGGSLAIQKLKNSFVCNLWS